MLLISLFLLAGYSDSRPSFIQNLAERVQVSQTRNSSGDLAQSTMIVDQMTPEGTSGSFAEVPVVVTCILPEYKSDTRSETKYRNLSNFFVSNIQSLPICGFNKDQKSKGFTEIPSAHAISGSLSYSLRV